MAILFSRVHPRRGFLFAQALVILFALFIWKGTSLPVFALGYFLLGGFRAGRPMVMAQARELVHDSQMGVTYGIMETISCGDLYSHAAAGRHSLRARSDDRVSSVDWTDRCFDCRQLFIFSHER